MIEKIDLEKRMSHYSSSDVLLLKKATELIAEKLNEVIDAVNPPVCFMCGNVITGNVKYHIMDDKVHCGCAQ